MNIVVFGTGWYADEMPMTERIMSKYGWNISGFLDNDEKKWGECYKGSVIYPPSEIMKMEYDVVLIALTDQYYGDVFKQLNSELDVPGYKIHEYTWLLKQEFIRKYNESNDPNIKETISFWHDNQITPFNQYLSGEAIHTLDEVFDDAEGDPFIAFRTDAGESVKLYYPRDFKFYHKDGRRYVKDLLVEQLPGSPHAYFKEGHRVKKGDIIADCGVCEGNFSLRFADIASKIYLFEAEERWIFPLKKTFAPFAHKTEIINGFVSNDTNDNNVRLDDVIDDQVDFIKMDIEGAEEEALKGARKLMTADFPKCSICGYHRTGSAERIKDILSSYGYQTSFSDGFMTFVWGEDEWMNLDFRKGMVYGDR